MANKSNLILIQKGRLACSSVWFKNIIDAYVVSRPNRKNFNFRNRFLVSFVYYGETAIPKEY
jgi:hypothetical protein